MIHTPEGYIITDIAMLPDKKGYAFSNIQKISETKAPVSYTHLDVYKRQDGNSSLFCFNILSFAIYTYRKKIKC